MNAKKFGKFLKKLREDKGWSQYKLAKLFTNIEVTTRSISSWESGKSVPDIEKIVELSNVFGVTVDELLEGEKLQFEDLKTKYFIVNPSWHEEYGNNDIYPVYQEQLVKVTTRFNSILEKRLSEYLTTKEEDEFSFLFRHFYVITQYCIDRCDDEVNDDYLKFKKVFGEILSTCKNKKDILYEVNKLIIFKESLLNNLNTLSDVVPGKDKYQDNKVKNLEFWEKDMVLSSLQVFDFVIYDPTGHGLKVLEDYENKHGHPFNRMDITRKFVKYLIENGACLNSCFVKFKRRKIEKRRIIDRLEQLYMLCKKPIEKGISINGEYKELFIENNMKNRFIKNLYFIFESNFKYSVDEAYEKFILNDADYNDDELYMRHAEVRGFDLTKDIKEIKAHFEMDISYFRDEVEKFKYKELEIKNGLIEIDELLDELKSNNFYYNLAIDTVIGGENNKDFVAFCRKSYVSFSRKELLQMRDLEKTKRLYEEIDNLSLEEIRNKYFEMEVIDDECR